VYPFVGQENEIGNRSSLYDEGPNPMDCVHEERSGSAADRAGCNP
jgi:hypothetical protein